MDGCTKIIAFFLPQFHEIDENNDWWEKGFTEWIPVKRATALFTGHNQPRLPLNANYYDLMDKKIVEWQTQLMGEYCVDAFAYYHYWYEGKLLLERPAENLLAWRDVNQKFMFFWANHTWYRSHKGQKTVLIEQTYGKAQDWKNHYYYMRNFFLDERYLKINNRPILGIYMAEDVPDYDEMILSWNELSRKDGFAGVYIVESINNFSSGVCSQHTDGVVLRQPNLSREQERRSDILIRIVNRLAKIVGKSYVKKIDYRKIAVFEKDIDANCFQLRNAVPCYAVSTGWDNTPRHGKFGQAMVNMTPELFEDVVYSVYLKSLRERRKLFFVNAWNEWAEGMVLEPDEQNEYGYLKCFKQAIVRAREKVNE